MNYAKKTILFILIIATNCIVGQSKAFKNYSLKDGLPQSNVVDAAQDTFGYLWFATQGGGLAKFDGATFTIFNQNNGLASNYVNALLYKKDSLFIATDNGLTIKSNNNTTHFNTPKINAICKIKDAVFLATNQGVYQFKKNYVTPIQINLKIDLSVISNISYYNAHYWVQTNEELWKINTLVNPTHITKATYQEIKSLPKNYTYRLQIPNDIKSVTNKIFKDKTGNFWILTSTDGIYKPIENSFTHINTINNQKIRNINAIHALNNMILFSDGNFIYQKDSTGLKQFNTQKHFFKTTSITSDKGGNLWFGSENNGLFIYRKQQDTSLAKPFTVENLNSANGLPVNAIQQIIIDDKHVWVTSKNNGIIKLDYDFENGIVKKIIRFNKTNGLKDTQITSTQLHRGKIWYTTKKGSIGFIEHNSVTQYATIFRKKTTISSIAFKDDIIYLGTLGNGLWRTKSNDVTKLEKISDSYSSSQNVYQILVDNTSLWIGSEKGLDKIDIENNQIKKSTHFNANDGFTAVETSRVSIKDKQGVLWFGTVNGITRFEPKEIKINKTTKPDIFFEKITVNFQLIDSIPLTKIKNIFQLNPTQNNLSFRFKTIDFNYPERIQYQYEINGKKSNWSTNNTLNLANLKSDLYILKIRSRISHNQVSNTNTFAFFIDKPLLKKTWFLWLISITVFLIILFSISLYISNLKKKSQEKINKLTLEKNLIKLEQKALQLQMNPHFIFNVLNGIKALGNNGKTTELNNTVSKFATLLRSTLQNSRKEEVSLKEEIETLTSYLELEKQLSSKAFEYTIKTDFNELDAEEILIPPMLIQPFIENSIKHGFRTLSNTNLISICFGIKNNFLHCNITDNGIGFVQSQKQKTNATHKSVAIKVTKERIKNLSKFSTIEMKELKENKNILGTKVTFKIPLKTDF
ncbi:MAG: histidine kinase [Flavobacteriaceae bacterium]|nr:histidine kinase [Flavobacteriaceae bacterium]